MVDISARFKSIAELIACVSERGSGELFVPTCLPDQLALPLGARVRLTVRFEDDPGKSFCVPGRLDWKRMKNAGGLAAGLGVAFVPESASAKQTLFDYVTGKSAAFVQRSEPRLRARLTVRRQCAGEKLDELTEDISNQGAFIRTAHLLPIGTEVKFDLKRPLSFSKLSLRGRVTWQRTRGAERGMGVRFIFTEASQVDGVKNLVDRLQP